MRLKGTPSGEFRVTGEDYNPKTIVIDNNATHTAIIRG
jgi:hypothetical protein